MKKILMIILLFSLTVIPASPVFTQSIDLEDQITIPQEEVEEEQETESLSEKLDTEDTPVQQNSHSFLTILGAILIPSFFIIICYLILKSFKF